MKEFETSLIEGLSGANPLTLIVGSEEFLQTLALRTIESYLRDKGLDCLSVEGSEAPEDFFSSCFDQAGLFSTGTNYLLKRAHQVPELLKKLKRLPAIPPSDSRLFIFYNTKLSDALQKEFKRLKATKITCANPPPKDFFKWVDHIAHQNGFSLDYNAKSLLVNCVGRNLITLNNEIQKFRLIFPKHTKLSAQEMGPYLGMLKEDYAFKLRGHILDGHMGAAQLLLSDLLRRGESGLALLGILAKLCRTALSMKAMIVGGESSQAIASKLKLQSYAIRQYQKYCERTKDAQLIYALELCSHSDRSLKSSRSSAELSLSRIISALC